MTESSRATRYIALPREPLTEAQRRKVQPAAIEKAATSRMWLVKYKCGAVRFQPAEFFHELSATCPTHGNYTSEGGYCTDNRNELFQYKRLTVTEWGVWRNLLKGGRWFTKTEFQAFLTSCATHT